jgi:hypothetical protein
VQKSVELPLVPILHPFKQCGATGKRSGLPCVQPAMKNGRCRFHGGKSTGAKTPEGMARQHTANYTHGLYSREHLAHMKQVQAVLRDCRHAVD